MGILTGEKPASSAVFWIKWTIFGVIIVAALRGANCDQEPTESQCRPYIEKALKEQHIVDEEVEGKSDEDIQSSGEASTEQEENPPTDELTDSTESSRQETTEDVKSEEEGDESESSDREKRDISDEVEEEKADAQSAEADETTESVEAGEAQSVEDETKEADESKEVAEESKEGTEESQETVEESKEPAEESKEGESSEKPEDEKEGETEETSKDVEEGEDGKSDEKTDSGETTQEEDEDTKEVASSENESQVSGEEKDEAESGEVSGGTSKEGTDETEEATDAEGESDADSKETAESLEEKEPESGQDATSDENKSEETTEAASEEEKDKSQEEGQTEEETGKSEELSESGDGEDDTKSEPETEEQQETKEESGESEQKQEVKEEEDSKEEKAEAQTEEADSQEKGSEESAEPAETDSQETKEVKEGESESESSPEEEDLTKEVVIPENLRPRDHITKIFKLDEDSERESVFAKAIDSTLKTLKNIYDSAIKPLEMLYKYRDLSNRHFGDPEIFSKPLILFMGPWSGGKSSTINYLLDIEFSPIALRTGAEPSPAYFNILMHGKDEEILDGTQLAADWTFSGLQKFGQGLLDRLRGVKLPSKLLEKVNIVEIPGILEIRKQVQRLFPFNDACQWFIDRADIIFLVYDPSKLDVGPETEAILDQLKGREYQTRIILNKADQVKPEELMRVQGTLIWNISPLMSSTEPPIMYTTSLWSLPYETGAPTRLLLAQERAFLRDLREAVDRRVENKIASARRFAVRVRNHAKMVDCYLTTYYNHKTFFGNKKKISDDIIESPQKYHIYEGLSTLTNISRYDLPDPDSYRDFFKINPLYDFTKLSDTCTYFRGCPINKLDIAIAYDLPELIGKYRKVVEAAKEQTQKTES